MHQCPVWEALYSGAVVPESYRSTLMKTQIHLFPDKLVISQFNGLTKYLNRAVSLTPKECVLAGKEREKGEKGPLVLPSERRAA